MAQPDPSDAPRSEVPAEGFRMRPQAGGRGGYGQRTSTILVRCDGWLHRLIYTL